MQLIKQWGNRLISYFADKVYGQNQMYNLIKHRCVQQTAHKNDILFPFMYPDMQASILVVLLYNCKGALKNN